MKIAFLTPEFPHPKTGTSGGLGTSIKNLADGLVALGHEPSILILGQDKDEFFKENGIAFYRIRNVMFKGLSWYLTRKKVQKLINRLYAENQIDVVESPDWTGISAFIKPNCPLTIRLNGSDTYFCHLDKRPVKWFNRFLEKKALTDADAVLSVSRFTADVTNSVFGLDRDFAIIPNGIDADAFVPALGVKSNKVLYFGTLIRKKGALELPHIFNELHRLYPQAELILVGRDAADITTGSASTWRLMEPSFADSARAKVNYAGSVPYSKIAREIAGAAVCIFPTFAEALPVSWIEAMAMAKAVVASDIGWAPEVIEEGKSGFLVHPANHTLYAQKVAMLLADPDLREKIGTGARLRVMDHFDKLVVARKNVEYYGRLLNKAT